MDSRGGRAARPSRFFILRGAALFPLVFLALLFPASRPASAQYPASFNPAALARAAGGPFLDVQSFGADNAVPLSAIFLGHGWGGPFNPENTNHLDLFWQADAGAVYKSWRLAVFYRGELFAKASRDTMEFLRMTELKQDLPVGRTFNLDLNARGFAASGFEVSKGFDLAPLGFPEGLTLGVTARYLKADMIQQGTLTGTVTPTSARSYDFNLLLDYVYDRNYLYERPDTVAGTGDGYSFDLGLKYVLDPNLSAGVVLRDLFGRIYWYDTPYTTATAGSQTKFFDAQGYMEFRPTISGYESYKDFTQHIPLKMDAEITYNKGPFSVRPAITFIEYERPLCWINGAYEINPALALNLGYNFNYSVPSLGLSYKALSIDLYANDMDFSRASALGFDIAASLPW